MALNLLGAGTPLVVWNRSPAMSAVLAKAGALVAKDLQDVFQRCEVVILMLRDAEATDTVLGRKGGTIQARVDRHTIINMATHSPCYSKSLEADIRAHGGEYVEAPVSGSRKPAEAGQLVAMLAGAADVVASVQPLLTPMCRKTVDCGPTPNALIMKFTVKPVHDLHGDGTRRSHALR